MKKLFAGMILAEAIFCLCSCGSTDVQDNRDALVNGEYKTFEFGPFTVEAVAAGGNPNHDVKYCVGYLVSDDGYTIYHAGDTSKIEQMNALKDHSIDYAMKSDKFTPQGRLVLDYGQTIVLE